MSRECVRPTHDPCLIRFADFLGGHRARIAQGAAPGERARQRWPHNLSNTDLSKSIYVRKQLIKTQK